MKCLIDAEEWRPVVNYEGLYEVSSLGRVYSLPRSNWCPGRHDKPYERFRKGRVLKTQISPNGYELVGLHKEAKCSLKSVHRLVAQAFLPNPDSLPEVNHLDEVRHHNWLSNLEWATRSSNSLHSSYKNRGERQSYLTEEDVLSIVSLLPYLKQTEIAEMFGTTNHVVHKIKCGKNWAWLTGLDKEGSRTCVV